MMVTTSNPGPMLIAAGLFLLLVAQIWPATLAATAAMLIALGATRVLIARSPWRKPGRGVIVVHLVTYAAIYSLFVGALIDRSLRVDGHLAGTTATDLFIATCVLALVVRQALPVFRDSTTGRF